MVGVVVAVIDVVVQNKADSLGKIVGLGHQASLTLIIENVLTSVVVATDKITDSTANVALMMIVVLVVTVRQVVIAKKTQTHQRVVHRTDVLVLVGYSAIVLAVTAEDVVYVMKENNVAATRVVVKAFVATIIFV